VTNNSALCWIFCRISHTLVSSFLQYLQNPR
jgi:hypothetical protein